MSNEPVAYMSEKTLKHCLEGNEICVRQNDELDDDCTIPLYTHPVKEKGNPVAWRSKDRDGYWCIYQSPVKGAEPLYTGLKELTDEEILKYAKEFDIWLGKDDIKFIKFVLRKAQE